MMTDNKGGASELIKNPPKSRVVEKDYLPDHCRSCGKHCIEGDDADAYAISYLCDDCYDKALDDFIIEPPFRNEPTQEEIYELIEKIAIAFGPRKYFYCYACEKECVLMIRTDQLTDIPDVCPWSYNAMNTYDQSDWTVERCEDMKDDKPPNDGRFGGRR